MLWLVSFDRRSIALRFDTLGPSTRKKPTSLKLFPQTVRTRVSRCLGDPQAETTCHGILWESEAPAELCSGSAGASPPLPPPPEFAAAGIAAGSTRRSSRGERGGASGERELWRRIMHVVGNTRLFNVLSIDSLLLVQHNIK